jgi:hypothetical protein
MQRAQARPMYTGYPAARPFGPVGQHHGGAQGFCGGCGHPRAACSCGCRECRKEAKELLVEATSTRAKIAADPTLAAAAARMSVLTAFANPDVDQKLAGSLTALPITGRAGQLGLGAAFIGGGCCVHLSIEYTPTGTADGGIAVLVQDSNDTELIWVKTVSRGLGYQIKEGIVTTKPGAHLAVLVEGATARVRWCEVFSCC